MSHLTSVVKTKNGSVQGFIDTFPLRDESAYSLIAKGEDGGQQGVQKWLGIPYASAERWKRPVDPKAWDYVLQATEFGPMFPQPPSNAFKLYARNPGAFPRNFVKVDEHSHNANVFATEGIKAGDDVAVLVWIYGGSLNNGSADRAMYDPTEWLRREFKNHGRKFIVVSGNYRTNIFGFLASEDLLEVDEEGLCGNYGLRDCVKLLEWVQANIRAFGGDPKNVTVFGESAGAFIISHLLVTGKYLFRRAITESGACNTMLIRPAATAYPGYESVLSAVGQSAATSAGRVEALRAVPALELLDAHNKAYQWGGVSLTLETGPKAIWTKDTQDLLEAGKIDPWIEAVISGTNKDEGTMFVIGGLSSTVTTEMVFKHHLSRFPALQPTLIKKYQPGEHPAPTDLVSAPACALLADEIFVGPKWDMITALSKIHSTKVYNYVWNFSGEIVPSPPQLGAMHSIEIPFIFNSASMWAWKEDSLEAKAAKEIGERWAQFAIDGTPGADWPHFTLKEPNEMTFTEEGTAKVAMARETYRNLPDFTGKRANVLGKTAE